MRQHPSSQPALEDVPIEKMAFGGAGIARLKNGLTCFIRDVLPREIVRVRLTQKKSTMPRQNSSIFSPHHPTAPPQPAQSSESAADVITSTSNTLPSSKSNETSWPTLWHGLAA